MRKRGKGRGEECDRGKVRWNFKGRRGDLMEL
jgi:hypothetical protein